MKTKLLINSKEMMAFLRALKEMNEFRENDEKLCMKEVEHIEGIMTYIEITHKNQEDLFYLGVNYCREKKK